MSSSFLSSPQETYRDFRLLTFSPMEELDSLYREIRHEPTGATILHIENQDPENLFCLSFRTPPEDGTGTPHILEHTVLCGSKKFPVKDPFFSMIRRSMHTFMNAFTGADFTCYPAASQIEKDFYNLLAVYADAVFHPMLTKESFLQEGCRLEFTQSQDASTPLQYKGIVYNEMKGSLASGENRLWHAMLELLTPDLSYAYNAGGDPQEIPNLTHEKLLAFHKKHYHPAHCLFFFYGNFPLQKHLDFLLENVFSGSSTSSPISIPKQPRYTYTKKASLPYPAPPQEKQEKQYMMGLGWLTCFLHEEEDTLALSLLDSILTDTDASPLNRALLDSGLCTQIDTFLDTEMSEVPFVFLCKGCKKEDLSTLEQILLQTLEKLSKQPLPSSWIEGALHQLELSRLEIGSDGSPFGLTLFFRAGLAKQQGCDPLHALRLASLFSSLKQKTTDPWYFPSLIKKYFLDNKHRAIVVMEPDASLADKETQEEKEKLTKIQSSLTQEQKKQLQEIAATLEKKQKEQEDLSCLPHLQLQDVPKPVKDFSLVTSSHGSLTAFHHATVISPIVYADLFLPMPPVTLEELPYLHLLLSLIPELGAGDKSYEKQLEYMHQHTGPIGMGCLFFPQVSSPNQLKPALFWKGKALYPKVHHLFSLCQDMLTQANFQDTTRIVECVEQIQTSLQHRFIKNAGKYATSLALKGCSRAAEMQYHFTGLPYYECIQSLNPDPKLISILEDLYHRILDCAKADLVLSCDDAMHSTITKEILPSFVFPKGTHTPASIPSSPLLSSSQKKAIASQGACNIRAYPAPHYLHPDSPALSIATHLLEHCVLHHHIREVGGAYVAGASYNPMIGSLHCYSQRDPHILHTFAAFDKALSQIASGDFSENALLEAKLSILQELDAPIAPGSRGILAYSWMREGKTLDIRQKRKNAIFSLQKQDIQDALQRHREINATNNTDICFASKTLLETQCPSFLQNKEKNAHLDT